MLGDIRYAFRQLRKSPGFTLVALLTLGLGIGVNTTMFTVLNGIVLKSTCAADSGRLVMVVRDSQQSQSVQHSPGSFQDLKAQSTMFQSLAAFCWDNANLVEPGEPPERLTGLSVSADYFPQMAVAPAMGRFLLPEDDRPGAPKVAVLSDRFWRSHFGGDPGVVGREVRLDGQSVAIVGIMPRQFEIPTYFGRIDLWRPLAYDGSVWAMRGNAWLQVIGRLKPGVSLPQVQAEASAIASRAAREHPLTDSQYGFRAVLWDHVRVGDVSRRINWLCMWLAGFVLLIACANLANLQLARMANRMHEQALRSALGASRLQLMRQLLVESVVLALGGGVFGVMLALWSTRFIGASIVIGDVAGLDLPVDGTVLAFSLLASLATGVFFGIAPAWVASHTDFVSAMKQGARGSTAGASRHLLRKVLIVSELTMALVLLTSAGYFVRGMQRLATLDMGWKPDGLVTAGLNIPFSGAYANGDNTRAFLRKLEGKLQELPGVQAEAISATLPITGYWQHDLVAVQGRPAPEKGREPSAYFNPVSPGYFTALGVRLVQGRTFTDADGPQGRPVAVINEAMANKLWPGENPLGKQVQDVAAAPAQWLEIVGVVADVHAFIEIVRPVDTPFQVYRPIQQVPPDTAHYLSLSLRSSAPLATLGPAMRRAVAGLDADEPLTSVLTAPESAKQITSGFILTGRMLGAFAAVGLILAAVGLYGVIANLVAQRTAEIGIRMALGAQVQDILWMVLGQGVRLALLGVAIGLLCAWGLVRLLTAMLPAIPGDDPRWIAAVAVLLAGVALLASWLPARRAMAINPIEALRSE